MNEENEKNYSVRFISFLDEEETLEPPPPGFVSQFNTIKDWLINICKTENPQTNVASYNIGLFESPGIYVMSLIGMNKTTIEKNHSITQIVFEPSDKYFPLPVSMYEGLSREQVIDKIIRQLKDFLSADNFKTSFLAKANSITTDFAGVIWSGERK